MKKILLRLSQYELDKIGIGIIIGIVIALIVLFFTVDFDITRKCISFCMNISNNSCDIPYTYFVLNGSL